MLISLHKNATTTPATRLALQQASGTDRELAQQYGIGIGTVRKWRGRTTVHDASHTAHRLQTTLNAGQEELVIYLRSQLRLPLDDLLAVVREFIEPAMSRSALDRLLRRRGHSRLPVQPKPEGEHKPFKAYEPGYVHVDVKYLPQMHDEDKRRYVFVAIDRATRWVFIDIKQHKTAASAKAFLAAVRKAAAFKIHTILTDNGKEFTDRLFGSRTRQPSGEHEFDQLCQALGIEHRLTKPKTPQTNGMVERFNGRLSQVLRSHHFNSAEDLEKTLHRFVWLYNHHLPQKALGHEAPVQALKKWKMKAPDLFVKNVRNHPGPESDSSTTVYTTYGYPPPPRVEYRTVAPAPNYIWIGGDWFWTGNRYDWRPGRWAPPGYHYVPPPPPRPHFRPPPPPVRPAPWPSRPEVRPDDRPRPPFWRPDDGPRPPQVRPDRPDRPDRGEGRPPQWRPDGDGRPQVRPDRPRPPEGRPERPSREEGRAWPSHRRDRAEGGRD